MEVAEGEVQRLPPEVGQVGQVPVELVEPQVLMLEVLAVPVEVQVPAALEVRRVADYCYCLVM